MSPRFPRTARRALVAGGVLAGLAAPAGALAADPPASQAIVLSNDRLYAFETAYPAEATTPVAVTGLEAGDTLVGIDVRPQNGQLYGLGHDAAANTIRLYSLSARTGRATAVATDSAGAALPGIAATGASFGFDFNPTADRVRVVSDTGRNLRLDPNTGLLAGSDTDVSPSTVEVDGAAYTNDEQNATATTLYTLSGAGDELYVQGGPGVSPNAGVQNGPKALTVSGAAVDIGTVGGFDIAPGVDVTASGAGAPDGSAGFVAATAAGRATLAKVDLGTGALTPVGVIGDGNQPVQGLAIQQEAVVGGVPAVTVNGATGTDAKLRRFNTSDPLTGVEVPIAGIPASETPVGVDWRPQTGQLLVLGVNAPADAATLYRVDPQSGAATALGGSGGIAFVTAGGSAVDLPPATAGYDIDVDPTLDRLRVVTGTGLNFRVNPVTGAAVDGDGTGLTSGTVPGVNADAPLAGAVTGAVGTAYTNSFGQTLPGAATTQYDLSPATDQLVIQAPPSTGTTSGALPVKVGTTTLDFTNVRGFDIPAAARTATSGSAATGTGVAVLSTAGTPAGLYAIDLATGAATLRGTLSAVTPPTSLAVGDGPPPAAFRPIVVVAPPITTPTAPTSPTTPAVPKPAKAGFASSTKVTLRLRATRVAANGPARITFRNANAFAVRARLTASTPRSGKRKAIRYATKSFTLGAKRSRTLSVRLPAAARKALRTRKRLTIRATLRVTAPDGRSRNVRKTLTLRRK